jgi:hypothetical protein
LGDDATVSPFTYEPAEQSGNRFPDEFWAIGLRPLSVPAVVVMGSTTFARSVAFPLVRAEGHGATGGNALAGTLGAAKLLVIPTDTWLSPTVVKEFPGAPGVVSPLLTAESSERLMAAVEWFHITALTKMRDKASPGSSCPCGRTTHTYPEPGEWRLTQDGTDAAKGWNLVVPGFEAKPVHIRRPVGAALAPMLHFPRRGVLISELEASMKTVLGEIPKTPIDKQLSMARKAVCERTGLCEKWMERVVRSEGDSYVFDPEFRQPSDIEE